MPKIAYVEKQPITRAGIIKLYIEGTGTLSLARQSGLHRSTIQRILKQANIDLRKRSPDHPYDTKFFGSYTPTSCYWAGFILADGYIRPYRDTVNVTLAQRDRAHLVKLAAALRLPESVVHTASSTSYCYIDVNGPWARTDLIQNFGITPHKTRNATLPCVSSENRPHLVRGIFDGDGSITLQNPPQLAISGTVALLSKLREVFFGIGVRIKSRNRVPPIQNAIQISYSGRNAGLILGWMYKGSTQKTRLDRKYLRFLQIRRSYLC